jgi:hypothetical protein
MSNPTSEEDEERKERYTWDGEGTEVVEEGDGEEYDIRQILADLASGKIKRSSLDDDDEE